MAMLKSFRGEQIQNGVAWMDASARSVFIAKVYNLLFAVIALMVAAGYVAFKKVELPVSSGLLYTLLLAPLGILLIGAFTKKIKGLNLVLFAAYGILEGMFLGVLAKAYVEAGLGIIFAQAAILSLLVFGGLTAFVHVTKKDFSFLGAFLSVLIFVLLGAVIVGFFVKSTMFHLIVSAGGTAIFALYILFDTSQILHYVHEDESVSAAWMLFIDLIGLFIYILNLLTILSGNRD